MSRNYKNYGILQKKSLNLMKNGIKFFGKI